MSAIKNNYVRKLEQAIVAVEDGTASKDQEEFVKQHEQRVLELSDWGEGFMHHAQEVIIGMLDYASEQAGVKRFDNTLNEVVIVADLIGFMETWGIGHPWWFDETHREMQPGWEVPDSDWNSVWAEVKSDAIAAEHRIAGDAESEMRKSITEWLDYNEADWLDEDEFIDQMIDDYDADNLAELYLILCQIGDNEE